MKIVTVLGARPQFIKAAPLSRALAARGLTESLLHTGQHYDPEMSDVFFRELSLPAPAYHLGVGSGPHGEQTGRMLSGIEAILTNDRPDLVLVYGDTNSTLAGALAAVKLNLPVAHVEAGLRSFNRRMPEEINRIVVDAVASLLFVPVETAVTQLKREGIPDSRIHLVGDVMFDAALMFAETAKQRSRVIETLDLTPKQYALATIHRAENTDDRNTLERIFAGLADLCRDMRVVCPLHPRTAAALAASSLEAFKKAGGIASEPVGFIDMVRLEQAAGLIVTDSGGVQKEAFFHQVPCITLRSETEWTELVEGGWNTLLPPAQISTVRQVARAVMSKQGRPIRPYGNGRAAERIAAILARRDF
ncbi:MAG: UDP-N-acetylglucosamine 2-epimerase (non-hydrolyzing) [Xanthobacteraceae bacterium]